ncbi:Lipoyl synthase [Buchnera aphidicola (Pemphigus populi)]|uniref:lipoyl synthase n=1 Tax=Buchnera aphidicola TaxID=9 RepID=UPI003A652C62
MNDLYHKKLKYKNRNILKSDLIPIKMNEHHISSLKKPNWIKVRIKSDSKKINRIKNILKENNLHSVCEEALCPNLSECFNNNTATFMILGAICTRRCGFCAVKNGRPLIPDKNEAIKLSSAILKMKISYVVITSVARDDLHDGGAQHFIDCIQQIRKENNITIEILVPDFRGRTKKALKIINKAPPDVFNHNLENVPRLYSYIRPGADYYLSLRLLEKFKLDNPTIPTKSGLMLGLGEKYKEVISVMRDLRYHGVTMITLGQYLQPSSKHLPVKRYITPLEFEQLKIEAYKMGFTNAFCGPLVRSSYHANLQYYA